MSDHTIPNPSDPVSGFAGLLEAVAATIRTPSEVRIVGDTVLYVFVPDLTAGEAATFDDLVSLHRANVVDLSAADFAAMKPHLATGRAFLALSQGTFMGLTAAERDRMLFDNLSAQWRVLFRLLRD